MHRNLNITLTALAPIAWGSTYLVTSEWLPADYPITVAMLRALPAGLLLLLFSRHWPTQQQWLQAFVLGGLNFTIFWTCLFVAAYRLPGGVAATLGAIQPLLVMAFAYLIFQQVTPLRAIFAALTGIIGIALLVLKSSVQLDAVGISAALIGTIAMAGGTVLTKKWRNNVPLLTFTSWQLTAGGILLLPLSLLLEPALPPFNTQHILSFIWLGVFGAALSYAAWFRGIAILGTVPASILMFLSPVTAILLGWLILEQSLNMSQIMGCGIIFISIILAQRPPNSLTTRQNKASQETTLQSCNSE